jgi:ABC-type uncharacterized transport system permease subunit
MNALLQFAASHNTLSFAMGAGIMLVNLALMIFGMDRILNKKLIALGLPAIVLKYALLGFFLYQALRFPGIELAPFSLGLATPVLGYICYLLGKNKTENPEPADSKI